MINPNAALSQVLIKTTGGISTYYIYGPGLIAEQTGTEYKTYHYDLRCSTIALTSSAGLVTDTFIYAPYGELLSRTGTSDVDYLYNGRDGVITDDNGLYQMRARYYDPELRRFLNEDEYAGKYDDILNVNLYAYCQNDPIQYVDPSGHFIDTIADATFLAYDVWSLIQNPTSATNWAALTFNWSSGTQCRPTTESRKWNPTLTMNLKVSIRCWKR